MNTRFRKIGMGAVALTLAAVLGGCNNGDGSGSSLIELFFGINGAGNCNSVVVEVDLDNADAVIARDSEGDVQCQLDDDLDDDGCDVVFSEPGNGILRATITGCTIPGVASLFSCLFEDVDISDLQDTATGQCTCEQGCDNTPPVCISTEPDPTSCEICDNGVDDDGNGDVDCEDPNCQNSPDCEGTTTSTTSTSLTSSTTNTIGTTTTSSSTTTSITLPPGLTCHVFLRLADDAEIGSLQFDVDYGDAPGEFAGTGGNVQCESLITGSLASFNDKEDQEILTGGIISLEGFTGPTNVADCTFTSSVPITPADFTITVTEASDPDLNPVTPTPDVVIVSPVECEGDIITTTTIDTGVTTTTEVVPTTTTISGNTFSVLFRLTSASAAAGALQFHTDYSAAPGEFQGTGAAVNCTNLISGALFAPNDIDATNTLNLGIISLSPITAPIDLVRCTFDASGGTPVPADFPVVIDDATDPDGAAIDAAISVTAVTAIP